MTVVSPRLVGLAVVVLALAGCSSPDEPLSQDTLEETEADTPPDNGAEGEAPVTESETPPEPGESVEPQSEDLGHGEPGSAEESEPRLGDDDPAADPEMSDDLDGEHDGDPTEERFNISEVPADIAALVGTPASFEPDTMIETSDAHGLSITISGRAHGQLSGLLDEIEAGIDQDAWTNYQAGAQSPTRGTIQAEDAGSGRSLEVGVLTENVEESPAVIQIVVSTRR